jgi:hypothetical protein
MGQTREIDTKQSREHRHVALLNQYSKNQIMDLVPRYQQTEEIQALLKVGFEYACDKDGDYSSESVNRPVALNQSEQKNGKNRSLRQRRSR